MATWMAFIATQIYVCRTRLNASVCGIRLFYDFIVCMHIKMTAMCAHFMHFCNKKYGQHKMEQRNANKCQSSWVPIICKIHPNTPRPSEAKWWSKVNHGVNSTTNWVNCWEVHEIPEKLVLIISHCSTQMKAPQKYTQVVLFGIFEGKKKQKHFFHAFVSIQEFSGWNGNSVGLIGKWQKFYYPLHMIICIQSILCVVIQKIQFIRLCDRTYVHSFENNTIHIIAKTLRYNSLAAFFYAVCVYFPLQWK